MIKHLGCIMSGNRTWAKRQGWLPIMGYKYGVQAIRRVLDFCLKKNIPYVSLYTFSIENFKRPENEKNYLFKVLAQEEFNSMLDDALEKGVRIKFVGDRALFPESVASMFAQAEERTAHFKNLTVNFLFCYGGRQEIVHAAQEIARKVKAGQLQENQITPELFSQNLWTEGIPDLDLIIRPDGEKRLSNFLLYQAAYAELYFLDCMWPGLSDEHLETAWNYYNSVKRNFGA
jgi:undecaprenyl diphosphate synthase